MIDAFNIQDKGFKAYIVPIIENCTFCGCSCESEENRVIANYNGNAIIIYFDKALKDQIVPDPVKYYSAHPTLILGTKLDIYYYGTDIDDVIVRIEKLNIFGLNIGTKQKAREIDIKNIVEIKCPYLYYNTKVQDFRCEFNEDCYITEHNDKPEDCKVAYNIDKIPHVVEWDYTEKNAVPVLNRKFTDFRIDLIQNKVLINKKNYKITIKTIDDIIKILNENGVIPDEKTTMRTPI